MTSPSVPEIAIAVFQPDADPNSDQPVAPDGGASSSTSTTTTNPGIVGAQGAVGEQVPSEASPSASSSSSDPHPPHDRQASSQPQHSQFQPSSSNNSYVLSSLFQFFFSSSVFFLSDLFLSSRRVSAFCVSRLAVFPLAGGAAPSCLSVSLFFLFPFIAGPSFARARACCLDTQDRNLLIEHVTLGPSTGCFKLPFIERMT